jgi:hypothetical protein
VGRFDVTELLCPTEERLGPVGVSACRGCPDNDLVEQDTEEAVQTVEKLFLEAIEEADNAPKAENSTLRAEIARINDRVAAEPWLNEVAKAIAPTKS